MIILNLIISGILGFLKVKLWDLELELVTLFVRSSSALLLLTCSQTLTPSIDNNQHIKNLHNLEDS